MSDVENNPYKLLGLIDSSSQADIKRAFKTMALKYHPDRNSNSEESKRKFIEIVQAYELLSDNNARRIYDNKNSNNKNTFTGKYYENLIISILQCIVLQLSITTNQR